MRAAVLGSPISHSLSPTLHRAAYAALDLNDWSYEAVEVDQQALPGFIAGLDADWAGLSLTMPLKETVIPLLDDVSAVAMQTRSVNTITVSSDGLRGDNTDIDGIRFALERIGVWRATRATVVGAGATARSAIVALAGLGAHEIWVVARRSQAVDELRDLADERGITLTHVPFDESGAAMSADVVVSTVPAGAADPLASEVAAGAGALLDVVYHPWPTPLAATWQAAGGKVAPGLDMLVGQAAKQVTLMTGHPAPIDAMLAAVR